MWGIAPNHHISQVQLQGHHPDGLRGGGHPEDDHDGRRWAGWRGDGGGGGRGGGGGYGGWTLWVYVATSFFEYLFSLGFQTRL